MHREGWVEQLPNFDGLVLPGTITSFAPQSEAYFMAHDIGSVRVDRGPGTASTIGYATFGGTVDIQSKAPLDTFTVNPFATVGSFNTSLTGVEVDSGARPELNGTRGYLDLQALESDGYLTGTSTVRRNAFTKIEMPVGENTLITFVVTAQPTPLAQYVEIADFFGAAKKEWIRALEVNT